MKRLLILFLLLAVGCNNRQQADSIIYYKSTDEDGMGVICFDGPITVIHSKAFYNNNNLYSIIIPNGVTSIGDDAFYDCENLTSITIPNSVTSIGNRAFWGCANLTSITIPNNVTVFGGGVFSGCNSLKHFYGKLATPDGKALIDNGRLISYACGNNAESYTIPNSVTVIDFRAFYGCSSLTSITIPDSVTYIGFGAFEDCKNLTNVTIGNSVTTINGRAFWGCDNLTSIIIPNSVTSIGEWAFWGCENLKEVYCKATTPPDTGGWWDAFDNNASGRKIYVPRESVEAYKTADGWTSYDYAIVGYDF